MLFERKLTERELDSREAVIQGLLGNKRNLVKKYGKDAEKVMYGIATKKAKSKVEEMNKDKIRELIYKALTKEDNDPSGEYLEGDPGEHVEEGTCGYGEDGKIGRKPAGPHLNKEEYAADKFNVNAFGYQTKYYKVCPGAKAFMDKVVAGEYGDMSNRKKEVIRLAQLHDVLFLREIKALKDPEYAAKELSTAEYIADEIKSMTEFLDIPVGEVDYIDNHVEIIRDAAKKINLDENVSQDNAVMELRNIVDELEEKADEAREIVRQYFPNELSRLDGYGVFNVAYSGNRYDVTLGKFVDNLEDGDYDDLDDENYPMEEDLDVGHVDDEPGMLKAELARAGKMIQMLYRAIDKYDGKGEVDFPQWWQSKIIKANDYLDSAFDYLDGKENVAKIDAVIDMNEVSDANMVKGIEVIKQTLSKEGGAAGLEPLVKELVKLGFKKDEVIDLLKKMTTVKQHRDGDYILLPLEEKELSKKDKKDLKKISSQLKKSVKAHDTQADKIAKIVREKLTKRHDVGDFVDDFKKSKAKQFRGKSAKKKKEMAVAAYLAKQND